MFWANWLCTSTMIEWVMLYQPICHTGWYHVGCCNSTVVQSRATSLLLAWTWPPINLTIHWGWSPVAIDPGQCGWMIPMRSIDNSLIIHDGTINHDNPIDSIHPIRTNYDLGSDTVEPLPCWFGIVRMERSSGKSHVYNYKNHMGRYQFVKHNWF